MLDELSTALLALSPWEVLAVVLALAYLLLAMAEHVACWACALGSTAIYTVLFFDVRLFMESGLNIYYLAMAVYGWYHWRRAPDASRLPISTWPLRRHCVAIAGVIVLSAITGYLLARYTPAQWPYVDSFTTWGSVIATWMVARKMLENWLYWVVLDAICIPIFIERGLPLTAALYATYLVLAALAYQRWRRQLGGQGDPVHA